MSLEATDNSVAEGRSLLIEPAVALCASTLYPSPSHRAVSTTTAKCTKLDNFPSAYLVENNLELILEFLCACRSVSRFLASRSHFEAFCNTSP